MADPLPKAELDILRGYNGPGYGIPDLRIIHQMNRDAAETLKDSIYLGAKWAKLVSDGRILAEEMTNRLNDPANGFKKQLYCDARKWVNTELLFTI